ARQGWLNTLLPTYYALDTLKTLGVLSGAGFQPAIPTRSASEEITPLHRAAFQPAKDAETNPRPPSATLPPNFKVFSLQLEAHGQGSPADAVELADSLNIHLWGAKNAKPEWIARAQHLANQQGVGVKFFAANEGYGTWIDIPG